MDGWILPETLNRSLICTLYTGHLYIVWQTAFGAALGLMVQRLCDGEEWDMQADAQEAVLLNGLLPACRLDAAAVDIACETAWGHLGP
jgi:hypothetical protein